jgi:transposase
MGHLFWLSDEAWGAIEPHLPTNQPGARRVDDRRVISGILHVLKRQLAKFARFRHHNSPSGQLFRHVPAQCPA